MSVWSIDLAVHDIDLIRWFTDPEIVDVQPQVRSAVAEREDIALLQFRTASGVLAQINTNRPTPFKTAHAWNIATRNKYAVGDLITRQVTEVASASGRTGPIRCVIFLPDIQGRLRAELQAFIKAVRERAAAPPGHRGRRRRQPRDRHALPPGRGGSCAAPAAASPDKT